MLIHRSRETMPAASTVACLLCGSLGQPANAQVPEPTASGGLWKTTSNGTSFEPVADDTEDPEAAENGKLYLRPGSYEIEVELDGSVGRVRFSIFE